MTHGLDLSVWVQTASAALYVALGVWVLTLTPRRRQTTLLGAFAILFGAGDLIGNSLVAVHAVSVLTGPLELLVEAVLSLIPVGAALVALALAWSIPDDLEDRRLLWIAVALGVGLSVPDLVAELVRPPYRGPLMYLEIPAFELSAAILSAAVALLALRAHPDRGVQPAAVVQLALLAVAFAVIEGFRSGMDIPQTGAGLALGVPGWIRQPGDILPWLAIAGIWIWNMVQADEDTVRIHRAAGLGILGLLAGGATLATAFPDLSESIVGDLLRVLGVGLLAYGVLRHDLAGLDAKFRFGVSRTTVAGVFIAVFFAASEGAQILFADFAGNEFLGVIAAGMLVFAISPLQRMADRFAAKAVPGGDVQPGAGTDADARATYRSAVQAAMRDGELTRREERHLADVASNLGLDPVDALAIREEVETGQGEPTAGEEGPG